VVVREKKILSAGDTGSLRGAPHCDKTGHDRENGPLRTYRTCCADAAGSRGNKRREVRRLCEFCKRHCPVLLASSSSPMAASRPCITRSSLVMSESSAMLNRGCDVGVHGEGISEDRLAGSRLGEGRFFCRRVTNEIPLELMMVHLLHLQSISNILCTESR
jgi:hypothetical protein